MNLPVREDKQRGVYVAGATEEYVTSADEVKQPIWDFGCNLARFQDKQSCLRLDFPKRFRPKFFRGVPCATHTSEERCAALHTHHPLSESSLPCFVGSLHTAVRSLADFATATYILRTSVAAVRSARMLRFVWP